MNMIQNLILLAPVIVSTLMMGVSYAYSEKYPQAKIRNLFRLWSGFSVMTLMVFGLSFLDVRFFPLVFVTWLLPMKFLKQGLERWEMATLAAGTVLSFILYSFFVHPMISALPFVGSFVLVGMKGYYATDRKNKGDTFLEKFSDYAIMLFFISRVVFIPLNNLYILSFIDFISLTLMALSLIPNAFEEIMEKNKAQLSTLVDQRNDKLIGQSKYAELGLMSAGIAHEINNPLAVIQAKTSQLLRLYRDPSKSKELGEGLEQILFTSERINRTIQGIREFVHQDENAQHSSFSMEELINSVLSFCGQRLKNHGINLRLYGVENLMVTGNKIQLEQILLNLINNSFDAIEFLPEKWIEVSAENKDGKIRLFFKDSGAGIPVEFVDKIMEPFFSTKDLSKGTGMGLSLARGIAEQHGGDLSYVKDSTHTTFLLELPYSPDQGWGMAHAH